MVSGSLLLNAADQRSTAAFASSAGPATATAGDVNIRAMKTTGAILAIFFLPLTAPINDAASHPKRNDADQWVSSADRVVPTGTSLPPFVRSGSRPCENLIGAMVSLAESRGDDEGFCSRGGSSADDTVAGMP